MNARVRNFLDSPGGWLAKVAGWCVSAILITAIFATILISFRLGIDRGEDASLTLTGRGHFSMALCGIQSVKTYGTGRYVCANAAWNNLEAVGLSYHEASLARIGKTLPQWLTDTAFLNEAIKKLFVQPKLPWDGGLTALGWGADAGYMDFVQVAFALFGPNIEALYYGFFLLLIVSSALICIQFANRPFVLFTVFALQYTLLYFEMHVIKPVLLYGINNPRFLSVLAILPLLHALFLMIYRALPSRWAILLFVPQAALMVEAGAIRGLAYWAIIALVVLSAVFVAGVLWRQRILFRGALLRCWPAFVVILCFAGGEYLMDNATDKHMAEIGGMRRHTIWEALYYNLQLHPDWKEKYGVQHKGASGDAVALIAANSYRERHHLLDNMDDYLNLKKEQGLTQVAYEKYIGAAYIEFVRNDPWYFLELKIFNAKYVVQAMEVSVRLARGLISKRFIIFSGLIAVLLIIQILRNGESLATVTWGFAAVGAMAILSAIPIWATVTNIDLMGDMIILSILVSYLLPFWVLVALGVLVTRPIVYWVRGRLALRGGRTGPATG